jgi:lysophospholipase L1-like esterase
MPRPLTGLLAAAVALALCGAAYAVQSGVVDPLATTEQPPLDPVPDDDAGDQLVVLFGDSLTEPAADRLRAHFADDPDRRLSLHWYGGTEVDTDAWTELYPHVGEGSEVLLALGINDIFDSPVADATADVTAAVDALTEAGASRVVMTTVNRNTVGSAPALGPGWAGKVAGFNGWLVAAGADDERFPTLEVGRWDEVSLGHADWLLPDGVHLTPAGGTAYADHLYEVASAR